MLTHCGGGTFMETHLSRDSCKRNLQKLFSWRHCSGNTAVEPLYYRPTGSPLLSTPSSLSFFSQFSTLNFLISTLYSLYSLLSTFSSFLSSLHSAPSPPLYSLLSILSSLHSTLPSPYSLRSTLSSLLCPLYSLHSTLSTLPSSLHSALSSPLYCPLHTLSSLLFFPLYSLLSNYSTLSSPLHSLHSTLRLQVKREPFATHSGKHTKHDLSENTQKYSAKLLCTKASPGLLQHWQRRGEKVYLTVAEKRKASLSKTNQALKCRRRSKNSAIVDNYSRGQGQLSAILA